ncbi:MAG TPA: hypothetical protein VNF07_01065 [Acidimicrobiales bacterium]|nr:hypothetical protein [Acidimicrobiales bacterium]
MRTRAVRETGDQRVAAVAPARAVAVPDLRHPLTTGGVLALQQIAGNRAVQRALAAGTTVQRLKSDAELLKGPLPPVGDPDRDRAVRLRIKRGQKQRADEKSAKAGWWGWATSFLPGKVSTSEAAEEENDEGGDGPEYGSAELAKGEGGASVAEAAFGDAEQEDADESKNPFAPSEIEINLVKGSMEKKGTSVGDVKGKAGASLTGEGGLKNTASLSAEGSAGKATATASTLAKADGMEGEGNVEFVLGASHETKSSQLNWDIAGQRLEGSGQLESFAGAKGSASGKASYNATTGDVSAKGKASALVGTGTEGTVTVRLKSGGASLGTVQGRLGLHYGVGGEIYGSISWTGGKISFSSGGKVVAGVGFSYGYEVELNTQALVETSSSWASALWSWLPDMTGMNEEDLWV